MFCELGGMRYMSSQALVRSLIENELKLETRPFSSGAENINYMRGQWFRNSKTSQSGVNVPYKLGWSERGRPDRRRCSATRSDQLIPGVTKMRRGGLREFLPSTRSTVGPSSTGASGTCSRAG